MKILAISYLFPNRVNTDYGIFVLNRLKAINKQIELKVINPIPWSPIHRFMAKYNGYEKIPYKDNIEGIEVYHPRFLSIPKYFKSIEVLTYYWAIISIINSIKKEEEFDLIDLHWTYPDLPAGIMVAKKYNKKLLVTLRGKEAFHFQDFDLRRLIVAVGLKKANKVIALSQELKEICEGITKVAGSVDVVRNGVDTQRFYFDHRDKCRERLGINKSERVIVTVGALTEGKGFDLLIRSLASILSVSKFEKVKLYIIGSEGLAGNFKKQLYHLVEAKNLKDSVVFVGQVANKNLSTWYNAADLFCLASRSEGSPNVLTEALACGCPAVATEVGCVKQIFESEPGMGITVPANNEAALVEGIKRGLTEHYNRKYNAAIFSKYNWDWCADQVLDIYRTLLKN